MHWIILNGRVPNLLENVNPFDHFGEQVSEDNRLSTLPSISPSFLDAPQSRLFSQGLQFGQDAELVRTAEINTLSLFTT